MEKLSFTKFDVGIVREIVSKAEDHHFEKCQKRGDFADFNLFDLLLAYEEVLKQQKLDSSTDTHYYKFLLDLSLAANRNRHLPLQSVLSKLIHKYSRNSFSRQHYYNMLKSKSFYVLYKDYQSQRLQRKRSKSVNNKQKYDGQKTLEFSQKELRKTLNLIEIKSNALDRKSTRSSVRLTNRKDSSDKENNSGYNKCAGTVRTGDNSINLKSNLLDDAQYLDTRVSLRSKASTQNLPVGDSRILSNTARIPRERPSKQHISTERERISIKDGHHTSFLKNKQSEEVFENLPVLADLSYIELGLETLPGKKNSVNLKGSVGMELIDTMQRNPTSQRSDLPSQLHKNAISEEKLKLMSRIFMKWLSYASKHKAKSQWKVIEMQKTIKSIETYCLKMLTRSFICLRGFSHLAKEKRLLKNMIANRREDRIRRLTFQSWSRYKDKNLKQKSQFAKVIEYSRLKTFGWYHQIHRKLVLAFLSRCWRALATNLTRKLNQRNPLQNGLAVCMLLYISCPIHGQKNLANLTENDLIEPFRIPSSRTYLITAALKQMETHLQKKGFNQLQKFLLISKNHRNSQRRKVLLQIFMFWKKKSFQSKSLNVNYQKSSHINSRKRLSKCWNQWKSYHTKRLEEFRVSQGYRISKRASTLQKAWALWRGCFIALTSEKFAQEKAINHRSAKLLTIAFSGLIQETEKVWAKNTTKRKSDRHIQLKLLRKFFNAWNSFAAKKLTLNSLLQKRISQVMKLKRAQCFKNWNELLEEVMIGKEAFFQIKSRKVFRCLGKISEFYQSLEKHAGSLAKNFTKQNLKRHFKSWSVYISRIVAKRERNSALFRKFQLSIKSRCLKAFKCFVVKKITNKKLLWSFFEKKRPKIIAKMFKLLSSYSSRKAKGKAIFEKISSQRAQKFVAAIIKTLKKRVKLHRSLAVRNEEYENLKTKKLKTIYFKKMVLEFRKINENEKAAKNFHDTRRLKRVFYRLLNQKKASEPMNMLACSHIQKKAVETLSKYFELWKQDYFFSKQHKLNDLIASQAYYKNRYSAFFKVLRSKIEGRRFYLIQAQAVRVLYMRGFFARWRKEFENLYVIKKFVQKRAKKTARKYFNGLKKFHKLKALRIKYENLQSIAKIKKTWSLLREVYRARNTQHQLLKRAENFHHRTLIRKGLEALFGHYRKKRDLLTKMIGFRKKRHLHIKQIFLDIIHLKKEKMIQRETIIKKFKHRNHLQKLRSVSYVFKQGVFLSRSRRQMLELALQSRVYRLKSQVFESMKNNLGGYWKKLAQAEIVQAQRSRSSLMKSFFCWKFYSRERAGLTVRQNQLKGYLEKKRMSSVYQRLTEFYNQRQAQKNFSATLLMRHAWHSQKVVFENWRKFAISKMEKRLKHARASDLVEFQLKKRYFARLVQVRRVKDQDSIKNCAAQYYYTKKCLSNFRDAVKMSTINKEKKLYSLKFYAMKVLERSFKIWKSYLLDKLTSRYHQVIKKLDENEISLPYRKTNDNKRAQKPSFDFTISNKENLSRENSPKFFLPKKQTNHLNVL